jgi:hypothetical protein
MEFKSIVVALILLAILFGWYAWLEVDERRRGRVGNRRSSFNGVDEGRRTDVDGEIWKDERK